MPAREGGTTRTDAGVRKPAMEETAGGVARWRVRRCRDLAAVSASTTLAIWHELCEWIIGSGDMLLALHRQATRPHRPSIAGTAMPLAAAPYRASGLDH
jgi:hypothetical protein